MNLNYKLENESYKYKLGEIIDFSKSGSMTMVTARRDWAAFQVLLQGDESFTLSVSDTTFFSPCIYTMPFRDKKHQLNIRLKAVVNSLPSAKVKLSPVGMIDDDDGVYKADMLLHNENIQVEYKRVQPVWVEIAIPEDTEPGSYPGEVHIYSHTMFEDEKRLVVLPFEITVKNVILPKPEEYRFHLDLWQHLSNISRKHEVELWSDEHFKVLERYVESLGDLGQKAVTIVASEIPWSGQACFIWNDYISNLFEYNMARISKNVEGNFEYDFSIIKRYIDMCAKHGIDKEIEVFGLINIWVFDDYGFGKVAPDFPDAIRIRYYDESDGCYKFINNAEEIKQYIKALEKFFISNKLVDRVRVVADEPSDIELYRERLRLLSDTAPSFKYKTAINHAGFVDEFKNQISDFVPILNCACKEMGLLTSLKKDLRGRILWYVCCVPEIPNTYIRSPLLESRLVGILTAFMEFDGFLRWNYTVWPERPKEKISYGFPLWKAGDTNFVYPSSDGRPVLTLRYKNLKRGIEDFELISMVKDLCLRPKKALDKIWDRILRTTEIKNFDPEMGRKAEELYSLNYEDYQWVKSYLLDELEIIQTANEDFLHAAETEKYKTQ